MDPPDIFRGVFEQIFFPYLAVDMYELCAALRMDPQASSSLAIPLDMQDPAKRAVLAASMRGLLSGLQVPDAVFELLRRSAPIEQSGLGDALLTMASEPSPFSIVEHADELVWHEATLWPVAYSTLFRQLVGILGIHTDLARSRVESVAGVHVLSEYPRMLPTHLHNAMASLAAWLGGAANMQYFSYFATQPQLKQPHINRDYAERIGYSAAVAEQLNDSGILALPASLVVPLLEAQGDGRFFGSIPIDERNVANPPARTFRSTRASGLLGFVMDKYYRAPFVARGLDAVGCYGAHDVLRDHYNAFYEALEPESFVRCKHYCAPVMCASSLDEVRQYTSLIPIESEEGLFFRGQTRFYALHRSPGVRQLLFASSTSVEPSLVTSAARQPQYDYDTMHFALKHFLESKIITRGSASGVEDATGWQAISASPTCELDYALMALAQHYGLPSHGLDVTRDEEIALWFATNLFEKPAGGLARYRQLEGDDWPRDQNEWPVIFVHQSVTHSMRSSLHDCHELERFGFGARRPAVQKAKFFLGGHSDHQNRLAETIVCVLRLRPGSYAVNVAFDDLFPPPDADPAYRVMLEFAEFAGLDSVHRFSS
jgi:hypothetical protein